MKLIDMHCDTLSKLVLRDNESLTTNTLCIDLNGLRRADSMVQFFACFADKEDYREPYSYDVAYHMIFRMIERMRQEISMAPDKIGLARSNKEIMDNSKSGKISALLTVEEGGILNGHLPRLDKLYQEGIRLITLTWNYENSLGYPNSSNPAVMQQGLKPFGFDVIKRMNELKMLIDVSHLSDGGFWDVIRTTKYPVVASHSNARSLCDDQRNMTDEMLKALGENGGVVGLNFCDDFLNKNHRSDVESMVKHIMYMLNLAGQDSVAIGTDLDGIEGDLEINHIGKMELLYSALRKSGLAETQLEKIWYKNALRVLNECMN